MRSRSVPGSRVRAQRAIAFAERPTSQFISKHGKSSKDLASLRDEISVRPPDAAAPDRADRRSLPAAQILRRLDHDNIVLMLDSFETRREFCVVTEFARGELFQVLEDDQRLDEALVRSIAQQLVKVRPR